MGQEDDDTSKVSVARSNASSQPARRAYPALQTPRGVANDRNQVDREVRYAEDVLLGVQQVDSYTEGTPLLEDEVLF